MFLTLSSFGKSLRTNLDCRLLVGIEPVIDNPCDEQTEGIKGCLCVAVRVQFVGDISRIFL
jgi:hypothetical protein